MNLQRKIWAFKNTVSKYWQPLLVLMGICVFAFGAGVGFRTNVNWLLGGCLFLVGYYSFLFYRMIIGKF